MATLINGDREDVHANTPANVEQPSTLQVVTYTIWDTVCSKTFAIGAMVGAALMYAGIRVAQAYLSEDGGQETDRPF
jgi:hypothetical protein